METSKASPNKTGTSYTGWTFIERNQVLANCATLTGNLLGNYWQLEKAMERLAVDHLWLWPVPSDEF